MTTGKTEYLNHTNKKHRVVRVNNMVLGKVLKLNRLLESIGIPGKGLELIREFCATKLCKRHII